MLIGTHDDVTSHSAAGYEIATPNKTGRSHARGRSGWFELSACADDYDDRPAQPPGRCRLFAEADDSSKTSRKRGKPFQVCGMKGGTWWGCCQGAIRWLEVTQMPRGGPMLSDGPDAYAFSSFYKQMTNGLLTSDN